MISVDDETGQHNETWYCCLASLTSPFLASYSFRFHPRGLNRSHHWNVISYSEVLRSHIGKYSLFFSGCLMSLCCWWRHHADMIAVQGFSWFQGKKYIWKSKKLFLQSIVSALSKNFWENNFCPLSCLCTSSFLYRNFLLTEVVATSAASVAEVGSGMTQLMKWQLIRRPHQNWIFFQKWCRRCKISSGFNKFTRLPGAS